jgi:uncharacterized membrane protein YccF (DUF307 family)
LKPSVLRPFCTGTPRGTCFQDIRLSFIPAFRTQSTQQQSLSYHPAMCGRAVSKLVLSNTAWFICGGFLIWLEYLMVGFVMCVTLVLMKPGYTILKLSWLVAAPLGADWGRIVEAAVRLNFRYLNRPAQFLNRLFLSLSLLSHPPACRSIPESWRFDRAHDSLDTICPHDWRHTSCLYATLGTTMSHLICVDSLPAGSETLRRAWFLL